MKHLRRVIIESPYAGDISVNRRFARACIRDSISREEAPLASHLLYPQCFPNQSPETRRTGIDAGQAWIIAADALVVYINLGITSGMQISIDRARKLEITIERRMLESWSE